MFKTHQLKYFLAFLVILSSFIGVAQIDRSNGGLLIEAEATNISEDSGLRNSKKPGLSKTNNGFTLSSKRDTAKLGKKATVDMSPKKTSKFIDQRFTYEPSWAKEDRPVEERFGNDQYLGDVKTDAKFVEILCRDHEFVDGDRVKIYLDEQVIEPNVYLQGRHTGFIIDLKSGHNKIDFQALNMGTSGPNTAELIVIDDKGTVIASNKWNLTTGAKATIVIIK